MSCTIKFCDRNRGRPEISPAEKLLKFLFLVRGFFDAEIVHWHKLDLICIGERRVDAFTVNELAHFCQDFCALLTEKIVNESFARIRMRGFIAENGIMP